MPERKLLTKQKHVLIRLTHHQRDIVCDLIKEYAEDKARSTKRGFLDLAMEIASTPYIEDAIAQKTEDDVIESTIRTNEERTLRNWRPLFKRLYNRFGEQWLYLKTGVNPTVFRALSSGMVEPKLDLATKILRAYVIENDITVEQAFREAEND